jgi:hypothetical protein
VNQAINTGKVIQGGIVAGIVINIVSIIDNALILGARYGEEQHLEHLLMQPRIPFMPIWIVLQFFVGIALVWMYAAVRPRLGPGPKTALAVGLVVGLVGGLPWNICAAAWSTFGKFLPFMWACETVVGYALGTLAGAWMYREQATA